MLGSNKGDKGDRGEQGHRGLKGDRGIQGYRGLTGPKGDDAANVGESSLFLYTKEKQHKHENNLAHVKGSISGIVLTVEILASGSIVPNMLIVNAAANTYIVNQLTGEIGKTGTYTVNKSQNLGLSVLKCLSSSFQEINFEQDLVKPIQSKWELAPNTIISASIKDNVLTVISGSVTIGVGLKGEGIKENTKVISQLSGTVGASGTYAISVSHNIEKTILTIVNKSQFVCNEEGWYNIDYRINARVIVPDNFQCNYIKGAAYLSKTINNQSQQISGSGDSIQSSDKNHQHCLTKNILVYFKVGDRVALNWWSGYYSGAPSCLQTSVQGLSVGSDESNIPMLSFEDNAVSMRIVRIK